MCFVQCCLNHLAASPPEADPGAAHGPSEAELRCAGALQGSKSIGCISESPPPLTLGTHRGALQGLCFQVAVAQGIVRVQQSLYYNNVPRLSQNVLFLP